MLWRIKRSEGKSTPIQLPKRLPQELGVDEKELESWFLERSRLILSQDVWYIHRERPWENVSDLVALDESGNLVVIEIKRTDAPREVIAQSLEYAAGISTWPYSKIEAVARAFHEAKGESFSTLREEHAREFSLEEPVDEDAFNQSQILVMVAPYFNEVLVRVMDWIRGFGVPVYKSTFQCFAADDGSGDIFVEFEPIGFESASRTDEERGKGEAWWINTCERYFKGAWKKMVDNGVAATYGPPEYGQKLSGIQKGDRVFLYLSGKGLIAAGIVEEPYAGQANDKPITIDPEEVEEDKEYTVRVRWAASVQPSSAVSARELRHLGHQLFLPTVLPVSQAVANSVEDRLKERAGG